MKTKIGPNICRVILEKSNNLILEKSNHLILILKFPNQNQMILSCDFRKSESLILKFSNQNQMILSCDFRKIESLDSDSKIFKSELNDFVMWF